MVHDALLYELLTALGSAAPLRSRAQASLASLARHADFDGAWLAMREPRSHGQVVIARVGLDGSAGLVVDGAIDDPARPRTPPGFQEALVIPLAAHGGPPVGHLGLLYAVDAPPSGADLDRLSGLAPVLATSLSPLHSLAAGARMAEGAVAGVVLLRDGTTDELPGLGDHHLLGPGSAVVQIACRALSCGDVFRSFLWPDSRARVAGAHVRLTVLAAPDAPDIVLGAVVVTPEVGCNGLTARELEVLGLLVEGLSNQEIAAALVVAQRTVAAHVEHLLHKLGVSTRTQAAVRAEREGCYVPGGGPRPPVRRR